MNAYKIVALVALSCLTGCARPSHQSTDRADTGRRVEKVRPAPAKSTPPGIVFLESSQLAEFIDYPERFKGKTIQARLDIEEPIFGDKGDSLRNYAGKDVRFFAIGDKLERLNVTIRMPDKGLPNAVFPNPLLITFRCKEGRLDTGNEALQVARP